MQPLAQADKTRKHITTSDFTLVVVRLPIPNHVNIFEASSINIGHPKVSNMAIALGDIAKGDSRQRLFTGGMVAQ